MKCVYLNDQVLFFGDYMNSLLISLACFFSNIYVVFVRNMS